MLGDCRTTLFFCDSSMIRGANHTNIHTLFNHITSWSLLGFCFWTGKKLNLTAGILLEIRYFYVPPFSLLHAFPKTKNVVQGSPLRGRVILGGFAVYHSTRLALCTSALARESVKRHTFTSTECARPQQN